MQNAFLIKKKKERDIDLSVEENPETEFLSQKEKKSNVRAESGMMDSFVFSDLRLRSLEDLVIKDHIGIPPWLVDLKGKKAEFLMKILENTMEAMKLSELRRRYIRHRVWMQMFDSVGDFFRVCEVILPMLGQPSYSQDEYDLPEKYRTPNMDFITVQNVDFKTVKIREKLDGTALVRYEDGDVVWLVGMGSKFPVGNSDVEIVEYTEKGVFNLWRKEVAVQGLEIQAHPYCLFDQRDPTWKEGFVIRHEGLDYKVKRIPTLEILRKNVAWEATLQGGEWTYMWPRPGKSFLPEDKARQIIETYLSVTSLIPPGVKSPLCVTEEVKEVGDVFNVLIDGKIEVRSSCRPLEKEVVSAKVILFEREEVSYLNEAGKMLDFVGGKIEPGETSYEAIIRESREETGLDVIGAKKIGVLERVTQGTVYTTFLYVAPAFLNGWMKNLEVLDFRERERVAPWVDDFFSFLRDNVGSFPKLRDYWEVQTVQRTVCRFKPRKIDERTVEEVAYDLVMERPYVSASLRGKLRALGLHLGRGALLQLIRQPGSGMVMRDGMIVSEVGYKEKKEEPDMWRKQKGYKKLKCKKNRYRGEVPLHCEIPIVRVKMKEDNIGDGGYSAVRGKPPGYM